MFERERERNRKREKERETERERKSQTHKSIFGEYYQLLYVFILD